MTREVFDDRPNVFSANNAVRVSKGPFEHQPYIMSDKKTAFVIRRMHHLTVELRYQGNEWIPLLPNTKTHFMFRNQKPFI